jgi:hypothetical protein
MVFPRLSIEGEFSFPNSWPGYGGDILSTNRQCRTTNITKQKTSFGIRDDDSLNCTCGRELIRWNGAHIWTGEVVSESWHTGRVARQDVEGKE